MILRADPTTYQPSVALFSFFLSHFTDENINRLFNTIHPGNMIIIDSYWGTAHKKKHDHKHLQQVRRSINDKTQIFLPKRFFEITEIEALGTKHGYQIRRSLIQEHWFVVFLTTIP